MKTEIKTGSCTKHTQEEIDKIVSESHNLILNLRDYSVAFRELFGKDSTVMSPFRNLEKLHGFKSARDD
jgi:hypothetical protein